MKTSAFGCDRWLLPADSESELADIADSLNRLLKDRAFDLSTVLRIVDEDYLRSHHSERRLREEIHYGDVGHLKVLAIPTSPTLLIPITQGVQITTPGTGIHIFVPKLYGMLKYFIVVN